ncbi:cysteine-rich receptor-like protein kinase 26 [Morus notabilis]|nr:cysteine-rich receptor-like protein kinase 26 [Morus notabilis]
MFMLTTSSINALTEFLGYSCNNNQGNYTGNSTYQTNLRTVLSSIVSNDRIGAFYRPSSYGGNPDVVYATGLCRGDLKLEECRSCLNDSRHLLTQHCPKQKEAVGWYGKCTLRYSNRYIFGINEEDPGIILWNRQNASSDAEAFNQRLMDVVDVLRSRAAGGNSSLKFAAGSANAPSNFQTIYALVQCMPDLSDSDCNDCIVMGLKYLKTYSYGSIGVFVGLPSCDVAYDLKPFYNLTVNEPIQLLSPSPPSQTPPLSPVVDSLPPPTNGTDAVKGKNDASGDLALTVVPSVVVSLVVLIICISLIYLRMRKRKEKLKTHSSSEGEEVTNGTEFLQFDFGTIRNATDNFSEANKLGQGGFGAVYKGKLSNGKEIAVKRPIKNSGHSRQGDAEFKNEVLLVAKLEHRNLVKLLGFCLQTNERVLVYEFVPNASLDRFIFDPVKRAHLDWTVRYKIIIGIARGLLYLHEESRLKIIHRDLKAGNILLDAEMNPKISDFGTARMFALDQSQERTDRIMGTYGYMAPEYARLGRFSVKSDVFSFGVLVLEIICGQRVSNFRKGGKMENLLSYAWENWKEGKAMNLVDPKMSHSASRHEIVRCIHIALLCVQEKVADRPTMSSVILMLSSFSLALRSPSRPAYFLMESDQSNNNLAPISENDVSVTELYPR